MSSGSSSSGNNRVSKVTRTRSISGHLLQNFFIILLHFRRSRLLELSLCLTLTNVCILFWLICNNLWRDIVNWSLLVWELYGLCYKMYKITPSYRQEIYQPIITTTLSLAMAPRSPGLPLQRTPRLPLLLPLKEIAGGSVWLSWKTVFWDHLGSTGERCKVIWNLAAITIFTWMLFVNKITA